MTVKSARASRRWRTLGISEVADVVGSGVSRFKGTRRYVKTGDVIDNAIVATEEVTYEKRPSRANMEAKENDVICARMRATEKVLAVTSSESDHLFSTGFAILRPKSDLIVPKFLMYYLRSERFQTQKDNYAHGATQKAINNSALRALVVPVPPLAVQQELVAVLEKADLVRGRRAEANECTNRVAQSVFLAMFGDLLRNPMKWRTKSIRAFCEMGTGGTPPRSVPSFYGGRIPWVKSGEVNLRYIFDTEEKLTESGLKNSNAKFFPINTVLVAMYGATAGKVAVLKIRATTNQAVCGLVPDPGTAHYTYLQHGLEYLAPRLISQTVGTGQPNLSQEIIGELGIPIPELELQERFAVFVGNLLRIQEMQRESAREANELLRFLMHDAFEGELELGHGPQE